MFSKSNSLFGGVKKPKIVYNVKEKFLLKLIEQRKLLYEFLKVDNIQKARQIQRRLTKVQNEQNDIQTNNPAEIQSVVFESGYEKELELVCGEMEEIQAQCENQCNEPENLFEQIAEAGLEFKRARDKFTEQLERDVKKWKIQDGK
eukprot:UN26386